MRNYFLNKITNKAEGEEFLRMLYTDGLMFHPEDDASDIIQVYTGKGSNLHQKLFTRREAIQLNERMDEVFVYLEDPCEFVMNLYEQGELTAEPLLKLEKILDKFGALDNFNEILLSYRGYNNLREYKEHNKVYEVTSIAGLFIFANTSQGHNYWSEINHLIRKELKK